ncbi:MAG: hypothetical protein ABI867_43855, partial [Kofleriaceae bacterium]
LAPERVYHPVLPIRVDDDRAGSLQSNLVHRLPGDLLAGTLEETSTLVLSINNIKNVIAMVDWDVTIVLVDVGRRRVVGRKRFQGEVPPSRTTYEYMGKMSDRFWGPIADWIESVTRR